jgi:nickel/cobalt exporter
MRRLPLKVIRGAVALCLMWLASASGAWAHPLGNFTLNHLSKVSFEPGKASVRYVLDMAEIPTFQALRDLGPGGTPTKDRLSVFGESQARALLPELQLSVDGRPVP